MIPFVAAISSRVMLHLGLKGCSIALSECAFGLIPFGLYGFMIYMVFVLQFRWFCTRYSSVSVITIYFGFFANNQN